MEQSHETWPSRLAAALDLASDDDPGLSETEFDKILMVAREVAHSTERRFAPISTYLVGRFVANRPPGTSREEALAEAVAIVAELLG